MYPPIPLYPQSLLAAVICLLHCFLLDYSQTLIRDRDANLLAVLVENIDPILYIKENLVELQRILSTVFFGITVYLQHIGI